MKKKLIKKAQEGSLLNNKTEWFENWYSNRLHLLNNKVNGIPGYGLSYRFTNMLEHTPEYYLPNPMYLNEANLPELPENSIYRYAQSKNAIGSFYPSSIGGKPGTIVYMSPDNSTLIHERTHAMLAVPIEDLIELYVKSKKGNIYVDGITLDKYLDDPKEIYARLMLLRYENKLDGSKKHKVTETTPQGSYVPKTTINSNESTIDFNILDRYNKDFIEFLLNDVAQTNSSKNTQYAKSGIKIKKSHLGLFTKYCNGKVTQKCIDKAKKSGNKKLVKRAVFAENARKWKHSEGGVIDNFKRLDVTGLRNDPEFKKNYNLYMNDDNLRVIQDSMYNRSMSYPQRIATLGMIISENGGDTKPHGNGAFGLIGWRGSRAINLPKTLSGQIHKLMEDIYTNDKDWSHGGKGSNVNSGKEMRQLFLNTNNTKQATKAIMKGYVRPEKSEWDKRLKLIELIKKYMK